jgi:tRNA U34 5-methylaminomethyl-2-thiouridine-forming methyltransferase MnmC
MDGPTQKKSTGQMAAVEPPQAPDLDWLDNDVPRAPAFDDTYFSKAGGLEETRHVFLKGNGLPERWAGRGEFAIAEFGFGTGLNFLTTLAALRAAETPVKLSFVSFELYPMTRDQLTRALGAFPELAEEASVLLGSWNPCPGWTRMDVLGCDLWLAVGDARTMIAGLGSGAAGTPPGPVDAWYLDGFSPAKNPELWGEALLEAAFEMTADGGTLATYTAAGWVRRNLQAAGFTVEKTKGFAGKREMVVGWK